MWPKSGPLLARSPRGFQRSRPGANEELAGIDADHERESQWRMCSSAVSHISVDSAP
jgi:hypothetical protein